MLSNNTFNRRAGRLQRFAASAGIALFLSAPVITYAAGDDYVYDTAGQPVETGSGQCVHGMSWNAKAPMCPAPTVVVDEGRVKIVFGIDDAEFFGFDKAGLGKTAKQHLDQVVAAIKSADDIHGILITGHADRIGPEPYNVDLARKRAQNAKAYLVSKGVPAEKIKAVGESLDQPWVSCPGIKDQNKLIACLAPNRRVDVQVLFTDTVTVDDIHILPAPE
jgi:OmpA-OmpF porin, OOP family